MTYDEARVAARRLFATTDGKTVMAYLEQLYYDCPFKDDALARQTGRRDVIQQIHYLMRQTNE